MSLSGNMIHVHSLLTVDATSLIDGYGFNGSFFVPALNRLEEHFGNPNRILNAFFDTLEGQAAYNFPESCTQCSPFS